jgi:hypothetical protein
MPRSRFDLQALYAALDEQRRSKGLSWAEVGAEVNRHRTTRRPISSSTITSLRQKRVGEGDGILQMLLWLGRSPESFVPGLPAADSDACRLPELRKGQILRWDTKALHAALDAQRREQGLTWVDVARTIPGFTPGMLTRLSKGGRIGFPGVMRLVAWLGRPAVTFTRIASW